MKTPSPARLEKLATRIEKTAFRVHQSSIEDELGGEETDWGMVTMFQKDLRDSLRVAFLVRNGKLASAFHKAWLMDTAARDLLDPKFWDLAEAHGRELL